MSGAFVVLVGCSRGATRCPSISTDSQWQALVAEMALPEYRSRRLDDYVSTLEAAGCQVARSDESARRRGAAVLDAEIGRSLPLFVPAAYQQRAHGYLRHALGIP